MLKANDRIKKHWNQFIKTGIIPDGALRPLVAESWTRCRESGLDPIAPVTEIEVSGAALKKALAEIKPVLDVAGPFMNALYATVGSQDLIVRLTDTHGWVIECFGDPSVLLPGTQLNPYQGMTVQEERIGTNAIDLAMRSGLPQQVFGAEHYHQAFHQWATSAAPIRGHGGQVMAVISISGPSEKVHPHTLGMVMAGALAIEHKLKLNVLNQELVRRNEHLNALMESISEGIICVDLQGMIQDINGPGRALLGYERKNLIGQSLDPLLEEPLMPRIGAQFGGMEDQEFHIRSRGNQKNFILNATPVQSREKEVQEYLLTFKESRKIYSQANRIIGARAIYTFEDILGDSPTIEEACQRARLVADSDVTVLLSGESGTGKELFAQSIHNASSRREQPFVFINCGAIPRDLVASELFGYVEGAFTGARKGGQPGKFELADGGTLFLDEIGDMPLDTQATLLRVLETRQVVRVGGYEVLPVDVRVIAASHKVLSEEVAKGTFRADLYYRLNVMPIHTPALRERKEDIRPLIDFFYRQFTRYAGGKLPIADDFYLAMEAYTWPGNVRELQNIMQMVTNLRQGNQKLTPDILPNEIRTPSEGLSGSPAIPVTPAASVEKRMLEDALKATGCNLVKTAALLKIGRSTLYRKIKKYGIDV